MIKEFFRLVWHFMWLTLPLSWAGIAIVVYWIGERIGVFNGSK